MISKSARRRKSTRLTEVSMFSDDWETRGFTFEESDDKGGEEGEARR